MKLASKTGFSLVVFFGFCTYTLMATQIVPFLTQLGYSPTQRGYVLSMASIIAIVGQIIAGYLSDQLKTMKKLFIYITILLIMTACMSFLINVDNFWYHFFIIGMGIGSSRIALNFVESWIMEVDGLQHEFGAIRAFGSFGWALLSLLSGFLITSFGYPSLAMVIGILSVVVIFFALQLPDANKPSTERINLSEVSELFKNRDFVLLILIYLIAFISYNADTITLTDYMIELGGDESLIGVRWFIQAMVEIPTMFIGYRILRRKGSKWMMLVGTLTLMLKLGGSSFLANNTLIISFGLLQLFCFPFLLLSQKDLVYKEVPERLRSTGQLVAISLSVGLGGALTPIISGFLVELVGIQSALYIFSGILIIPIVLLPLLRTPSALNEVKLDK